LRDTSIALADAIRGVIAAGDLPLVLAGDCSVILSALLATREGLVFIDGHVDFYQPDASPTGEVADMDLAIATGRGPSILTELGDGVPLVREEDVAAIGARDAKERAEAGSQDIRATNVHLFELAAIRERGIDAIAEDALSAIAKPFWCHIDADVLDDAVMPSVDYRQPGGLEPAELTHLLRRAASTNRMTGLSLAIYNPRLDPHGESARVLVDAIVSALR
jgi:arginase